MLRVAKHLRSRSILTVFTDAVIGMEVGTFNGVSTRLRFLQRTEHRGIDMDFQVREQTYFLGLAEDERRWLFFVSTPQGMRPIPIYVDAPESESLVVLNDDRRRMPN